MSFSRRELDFARLTARAGSLRFRLPFRSRTWNGTVGSWSGAGVGSSIDFQDHRPYVPGDDPRHLDWQVYARSGHYVMTLYRAEVSPAVDVILDGSRSMIFDEAKRRRTLELFCFALESGERHQCAMAAWVVGERGPERLDLSHLAEAGRGGRGLDLEPARRSGGLLESVPLRSGSLRVLVTDCLFPGPPETTLRRLVSSRGQAVVLAPWARSEWAPDWLGPVDLEDCESGARRLERIDESRLEAYRERYRHHFSLWEMASRRYGVGFARVSSEPDLLSSLREAGRAGVVELAS